MEKLGTKELLLLLVAGVVVVAVMAAIMAMVFPYDNTSSGYGMMGGRMMWGGAGFVFMIVPVGFFLLVLWLFAGRGWGACCGGHGHDTHDHSHDAEHYAHAQPGQGQGQGALDVLNQRYARGEITRDEYLRIKGDLDKK